MKMKNKMVFLAAAAALAIVGGCSQEAKQDLGAAGSAAGTAVNKTGEAVATDATKTGEAVKQGADNAAEAVGDVAQNAADATMTPKVKNALLSASGLETRDINVETSNKTVTLKGSVPDAKQKAQAEQIAKGVAGTEFKVVNQLTVTKM
jgi:hyperosmotically inducible periplasmic protein